MWPGPIQGVSQLEATRLVVPLSARTPTVSPQCASWPLSSYSMCCKTNTGECTSTYRKQNYTSLYSPQWCMVYKYIHIRLDLQPSNKAVHVIVNFLNARSVGCHPSNLLTQLLQLVTWVLLYSLHA